MSTVGHSRIYQEIDIRIKHIFSYLTLEMQIIIQNYITKYDSKFCKCTVSPHLYVEFCSSRQMQTIDNG